MVVMHNCVSYAAHNTCTKSAELVQKNLSDCIVKRSIRSISVIVVKMDGAKLHHYWTNCDFKVGQRLQG